MSTDDDRLRRMLSSRVRSGGGGGVAFFPPQNNTFPTRKLMIKSRLMVAVLLAHSLSVPKLAAQEQPGALPPLVISRHGTLKAAEGVVHQQDVTINPDLIRRLTELTKAAGVEGRNAVGTTIPLNLFEAPTAKAVFTGVVELAYSRTAETGVVSGFIRDVPRGDFTAVVHNGLLSLRVFTPWASWVVSPGRGNEYVVVQEADDDLFSEEPFSDEPLAEPRTADQTLDPALATAAEDGSRIDVVVLFTTATREYWGSADKVRLGVRQMEEFLNDALENSLPPPDPPLRVRFVEIVEVPNTVGRTKQTMLASTAVRNARRSAKADLVVVLATGTEHPGSANIYCGNPNSHRERALAYVRADYLTKIRTIPHEIGHLLGANHNPGANNSQCSLPDARGHFFHATDDQGRERLYGTIMSYKGGSNRTRYYSNPAVRFLGVPTGTDLRNNARAIRASRIHIANYWIADDPPVPNPAGPVVVFTQPTNGAELPGRSTVTITATVTDPDGVSTVELTWVGPNQSYSLPCPSNHAEWNCRKDNDTTYTWSIKAGTGSRSYRIRTADVEGNRTVTPERTLRLRNQQAEPAADILFVSNRAGVRQIYVAPTAGGPPLQLTRGPAANYAPAWSPDGKQIVFISERDGNPELYIMDSDGRNQRRLSTTTSREDQPAWRP